jgi:hypothetical protein
MRMSGVLGDSMKSPGNRLDRSLPPSEIAQAGPSSVLRPYSGKLEVVDKFYYHKYFRLLSISDGKLMDLKSRLVI